MPNKDFASMMPGGAPAGPAGPAAPAPAMGGANPMAMGGGAPMASPAGGPLPQASGSPFEQMQGGGSVTGMTQEADMIKEKIIQQLEEKGVFNVIVDDNQMQELMMLVEDLVEAVMADDKMRMSENPLVQVLAAESLDLDSASRAASQAMPGADIEQVEQSVRTGGAQMGMEAGPEGMMPPMPGGGGMLPEGM